ncbi:ATP-dependent RNA helicase DDX42 [Halotydeus destructor]|nr:ATP-dependent RNA helicase DDX42 [Halotydeus destructor]
MKYEPFSKNFYEEQPDIASLTEQQVRDLRAKQNIKVFGSGAPKPVTSFAHFGFDEQLMKVIRKSEYTQPTPIQAQAIPVALSGRDLIGIAKTGSGKTAAYLWPMIVHVMDQRNLKVGEGPIGLILAPTRELSQQIYTEAKKFGKTYNINVVCAYGGGSKWEQSKDLEAGAEIVVATPGRLIDLIKMKATNLQRVTCLVLDEADRMFSLGFEPQVRSICDSVRPDRQTMLFSATFKKRIEKLARDILTDPIKILQGDTGEANEDISQTVLYFEEGTKKWEWLTENLVGFMSAGSVLIFVSRIANAEELAMNLAMKQFEALLIHGDMGQASRNEVISAFKRKDKPILVATDIAARGLDISHIRTVVNYDVARDIDTHTHRIGRTGRAGEKGYAYTLVTEKDKEFAGHLVRNLEGANQPVPQQLMNLALQSEWFKSSRFNQGGVKRTNIGGSGLGYSQKSRPGLGAPKPTTSFVASSTPYNSLAASSSDGSQSNSKSAASDSVSSSRFASVKAQYSAHYMNKFKAATDTAWKAEPKPEPEASKKKSRWDS